MNRETYLGDGLYASFDGWQIRLRAPRENGDHVVFLEDGLTPAGVFRVCRDAADKKAEQIEPDVPQRPPVHAGGPVSIAACHSGGRGVTQP